MASHSEAIDAHPVFSHRFHRGCAGGVLCVFRTWVTLPLDKKQDGEKSQSSEILMNPFALVLRLSKSSLALRRDGERLRMQPPVLV